MEIAQLLATNFAIVCAFFLACWGINVVIKDPSFVDSLWALGMVVVAVSTYFMTGARGPHATVLTVLCAIWGLRLGLYLLWRWRKNGPDRRYVTMMGKAQSERGWGFAKASLILVFALQAPLQFIVCLPIQLGQVAQTTQLGQLATAGMSLAIIGIFFETVGDWQLARFKGNPANESKILDTGLWRYTRHPNYFGDACVWWGLFLIAAETGPIGMASLPGPILITLLLTKWSGVPTTEGRMRRKRPEYMDYVARTSGFIPMPPKRL
jgi:steroid 5-alpha reductase family enzyme